MDITHIDTLDPHDLDAYLNLLGLNDDDLGPDLDLEHGIAGLVSSLLGAAVDDDATRGVWRELERSYRVECGVSVQELWSSSNAVRAGVREKRYRGRAGRARRRVLGRGVELAAAEG
ncbi:hypothetical protein GL218_07914 [Daldinia childiae]|uniref:uncharacterized protein n=1 Tax=Daldinia childiae TaxID=326645 RepID=UPI0014487818|nr:uncharacterized protein GL218_07914 [Daldinia childiae]KAF3069761.1 hypothetical protein GL218_07914 [Daldinia childiae]